MAQVFVLFEHATGYALFKVSEFDEADTFSLQMQKSIAKLAKFKSLVQFVAFQPFTTGRDALDNMNSVSEGILHPHLQVFLENNLPKSKKKRPVTLGVGESKLASCISEVLGVTCSFTGVVPEVIRGIRFHFHNLVESIRDLTSANKAQLGLGHHYSRARVKFNVNKIDNMIIQSISILDQLDKDINTFSMRIREWYSFHFPELIKIVPENHLYIKCVSAIQNRKEMPDNIIETLENILMDSTKAQNVIELARSSMGMEISPLDLENVTLFAERVSSLVTRRKELMEYLKSKMHCVAPNLAVLIGETVGARLIAHAGSLVNLAKFPASTVQILGAEKALFRALKTRGNTPKYGLIYHSTFIGRAGKTNKGRISRYLANKCSVASRIDCFREIPTEVFGTKLRQQVEDRLKFYETGDIPDKNVDVMEIALAEADEVSAGIAKQKRKEEKKAKKRKSEVMETIANQSVGESITEANNEPEEPSPKKKKKQKASIKNSEEHNATSEFNSTVDDDEVVMDEAALAKARKKAAKKAKKLALLSMSQDSIDDPNETIETSPLKKKKKKLTEESIEESDLLNQSITADASMEMDVSENCNGIVKKKKKKKQQIEAEE